MASYESIGRLALVFAVVVQLVILVLQASALRRHGNAFFVVLCASSILGLVYSLLVGLPYLVPLRATSTVFFLKIGLFFGVVGGILAVIGTTLLFRSYSQISVASAKAPAGRA